jgi:hypothetical protein
LPQHISQTRTRARLPRSAKSQGLTKIHLLLSMKLMRRTPKT